MISRRNIRIKVMQTLYALESSRVKAEDGIKNEVLEPSEMAELAYKYRKILDAKIEQSSLLFSLSLLYIAKIMQYAEIDAKLKGAKYIQSEADKNVSTKLVGNEYLWSLISNATFVEASEKFNLESYIQADDIRTLYVQLSKTEEYLAYTQNEERSGTEDKSIFLFIWTNLILNNDQFDTIINESFEDWEDDKDMINILIENWTKKRKNTNFLSFISSDKKEYAHDLLKTTIEKDAILMDYIAPKLKNWDAERVAQIDLIVLKMGVAEFLFFPTIPTKVTINEYIEISKMYSTPQSGQFVNGVLDNILKMLVEQNKIRKVARP